MIDGYVVGVSVVLLSVVSVLQSGINHIFDISSDSVASYIVNIVGLLVIGWWALLFWEVYRLLNKLGNWRAAAALLIFHLLFVPMWVAVVAVEENWNRKVKPGVENTLETKKETL